MSRHQQNQRLKEFAQVFFRLGAIAVILHLLGWSG